MISFGPGNRKPTSEAEQGYPFSYAPGVVPTM